MSAEAVQIFALVWCLGVTPAFILAMVYQATRPLTRPTGVLDWAIGTFLAAWVAVFWPYLGSMLAVAIVGDYTVRRVVGGGARG